MKMDVKNTSSEDHLEELDADPTSVDDFIKELEEKEKDLDISSDLVIEVDESEVEHNNIHDSFAANLPNHLLPSEPEGKADFPPPSDKLPAPEEPDPKTLEKITKLEEETGELKESLARRQKDFENYRNRTERERQDTFRNVVSNVASQMLPVMDNLNRALDAFSEVETKDAEKDMKTFHEGIILVNQQLNEVLSNMGVRQIAALDEPFDPHFHEAVAQEETDEVPPETVTEEILRGYRIDDKVIRPSMVKVSAPSQNGKPDHAEEDSRTDKDESNEPDLPNAANGSVEESPAEDSSAE